jgi:hypothetical protein
MNVILPKWGFVTLFVFAIIGAITVAVVLYALLTASSRD